MVTIFLLLGLVACSAKSSADTSSENTMSPDSRSLSTIEELVLGMLKLEGTDQAVDATQAATLLPLWQAYQELQTNNSTATEEVNAVVSQIQSSMTSEQTKIINDMKLTSQDLMDTMASLGVSNSAASAEGTQTAPSGQDFAMEFQDGSGGANASAGSSPPSGGGGPQDGGGASGAPGSGMTDLSQSQIAAMQAAKGTGQGNNGIAGLIEKLISVLEQKIQG